MYSTCCSLPDVDSAFDESGTLTGVILVCAAVFLAIAVIWIIFCYCVCTIRRDARTVGVVSFTAVVPA